jgi:phospholipid/cholesterol/gamma-HCH transport system permease protein
VTPERRHDGGPLPYRSITPSPAEPGAAFRIERVEDGADGIELRLEGTFAFGDGSAVWREVRSTEKQAAAYKRVVFDLSKVDSIDGGAMALIVQAKWELQESGINSTFVGGRGSVQKILELYDGDAKPHPRPRQRPLGTFDQLGRATIAVLREFQLVLAFFGSMLLALGGVIRRPRTANWREVPGIMNRAGADAVPIVVLITFLIGFVMAFQAAVQLKQFGANIYVADLVGLSVARELGPLMTAIILCGRSGAAFAAELGTMRVSEEVDALRTMGFGPLRFLVFPRVFALFLVMPVLTLIADLVGITGGLVVGVASLDITITAYITETKNALRMWDIFQGLIKCGVFAVAIGLISCQQGLATSGGAEGVGRRTTSSVVISLFALILIDAGFTILFHALHL